MLSKQKQQFLKMVMRESVRGSFGKHILGTITSVKTDTPSKEIEFQMVVPHSLCRPQHTNPSREKGDSQLATSTLLAIFDELSTNNLMLKDKNFRGGVSLTLQTEVLTDIPAEEEVLVCTTTDKIGSMIGFCSMELRSADRSRLLARGKHVKFMPHGRLWDFAAHPFVLPTVLSAYNAFKGNKYTTVFDDRLFNAKHEIIQHGKGEVPLRTLVGEEKENGFVFQQLNARPVEDKSSLSHLLPQEISSQLVNFYQFKTHALFCNQLGALHGGAVATLAEETSSLARRELCHKLNVAIAVERMDTKYLNSMQGELIVRVIEDVHSPVLCEGPDGTKLYKQSIGTVYGKKGKLLCAEFVCVWKLLQ